MAGLLILLLILHGALCICLNNRQYKFRGVKVETCMNYIGGERILISRYALLQRQIRWLVSSSLQWMRLPD